VTIPKGRPPRIGTFGIHQRPGACVDLDDIVLRQPQKLVDRVNSRLEDERVGLESRFFENPVPDVTTAVDGHELTQIAAVGPALDVGAPHVEPLEEADHGDGAALVGGLDQAIGFLQARREENLAEDVLAILQSG
jgi:hypothetical protein